MVHWPEKLKWIEGKHSRIKYLQGMVRNFASLFENIFVRISRLPGSGVYSGDARKEKIIVSLTTYPARINETYYAIKSLMHQTVKADQIILWLSEQQFPDHKLPSKFEKLKKRGLEIKFTEDDLRSHKKYYYALRDQKRDELVITFDDDLIYEARAIERLIKTHLKFPQNIICNRGAKLKYSEGRIKRRKDNSVLFNNEGLNGPSFILVPSTGAGCLYPYKSLPDSVFNKEDILNLAFSADDIWIWYNSLKGETGIVKTKKISRVLCEVKGSQKSRLSEINDEGGENDRVLERLDIKESPKIREILEPYDED